MYLTSHGSHGCIERDNQNYRAMIKATKAVREENASKIDYERFESLLEGIEIADYSKIANELFVVFECIDEKVELSYEIEDRVIYVKICIPYEVIEREEDGFPIQVRYFLFSLHLLSDLLDVERLEEMCTRKLLVNI